MKSNTNNTCPLPPSHQLFSIIPDTPKPSYESFLAANLLTDIEANWPRCSRQRHQTWPYHPPLHHKITDRDKTTQHKILYLRHRKLPKYPRWYFLSSRPWWRHSTQSKNWIFPSNSHLAPKFWRQDPLHAPHSNLPRYQTLRWTCQFPNRMHRSFTPGKS